MTTLNTMQNLAFLHEPRKQEKIPAGRCSELEAMAYPSAVLSSCIYMLLK